MSRLTRVEKRELTTSQLLETARKVFLERGYHRATLDDIADAAGYSKGVVYARFATKDELFFALFDDWRAQRTAEYSKQPTNHATFEEFMRAEARRLSSLRHEHSQWYLLLIEFWTYAVRDARLRREYVKRHDETAKAVVGMFERASQEMGVKFKIAPLEIARAGLAMVNGFTLERLADPEGVPETLLESMFAMLANEVTAVQSQSNKVKSTRNTGRPEVISIRRSKKDGTVNGIRRTRPR
jgi:AcrR family transcriptional regulator